VGVELFEVPLGVELLEDETPGPLFTVEPEEELVSGVVLVVDDPLVPKELTAVEPAGTEVPVYKPLLSKVYAVPAIVFVVPVTNLPSVSR